MIPKHHYPALREFITLAQGELRQRPQYPWAFALGQTLVDAIDAGQSIDAESILNYLRRTQRLLPEAVGVISRQLSLEERAQH